MIKNTALGVLVLATFVWASAAAANDDDVDECGLYLAISSTSTVEDTHWGLYAGKEIGEGQPVGYPDIGINIPHLRANSYFAEEGDEGGEDKSEILTAMVDFFESFFWVPDTAGAKFELSAGRAVAAIPGAGVLAGYNAKMTNADWNLTSTYHRPSLNNGKPGEAHPNRGANSAFYNVEVVATTNIPPGSEVQLLQTSPLRILPFAYTLCFISCRFSWNTYVHDFYAASSTCRVSNNFNF
jgi:hypothetical protein